MKSGLGAEVERWVLALRGARGSTPVERLRTASGREPTLAELVEAIATAPTRRAGIAELNDRVAELARELEVEALVPRAAGRIALFGGVGLAIVSVALRLGDAGGPELTAPLLAFALGLSGALACTILGRAADARSQRQREAWSELRRTLDRALPERD